MRHYEFDFERNVRICYLCDDINNNNSININFHIHLFPKKQPTLIDRYFFLVFG